MHKVPKAQPLLRLTTQLALLALPVLLRRQRGILAEMRNQILDDEGAFGDGNGLAAAGGLDGHDGRLAEVVNLLEFGRREMCGGVAVEDLELVRDVQFLEQPEDSLGAGLFKPGCGRSAWR